jgi:hypothetical protein
MGAAFRFRIVATSSAITTDGADVRRFTDFIAIKAFPYQSIDRATLSRTSLERPKE